MKRMVAYCGLDCYACPVYLATREDDTEELARIASRWSEQAGESIDPGDLPCDGCKSATGRMNTFCSVCRVRACARERCLSDCAHCNDYVCETLESLPAFTDEARGNLRDIRKTLFRG